MSTKVLIVAGLAALAAGYCYSVGRKAKFVGLDALTQGASIEWHKLAGIMTGHGGKKPCCKRCAGGKQAGPQAVDPNPLNDTGSIDPGLATGSTPTSRCGSGLAN